MPTTTTIALNRTQHKAFVERLEQGNPTLFFSADNAAAINAYVFGFLYQIPTLAINSFSFRPRTGNRNMIEAVIVSYTY